MDLSHDIMTQIGEDIQIRRNSSALLTELTRAQEHCRDYGSDFYDYFAGEEWIDWFVNGWSLVEQRESMECPGYQIFDRDCGCSTFGEDDIIHLCAHFCSWDEAGKMRLEGELPIIQDPHPLHVESRNLRNGLPA